jgi:hypothetical protein
MFITKLDVVNACLATMGETPLNTLEDDHSYKDAALNILKQVNLIEQKRGWWFNSEYTRLLPDAISKYISVPQDAVAVKTIDRWYTPPYAQRGTRLYNVSRNTYEWERHVDVDLVRVLPFEDLPFHAADTVNFGTVMRFQREFDGDNTRYSQLSQDYSRARLELSAENTRNRRPNLLATASNQAKMTFIGGQGVLGSRIPYTPGWPS